VAAQGGDLHDVKRLIIVRRISKRFAYLGLGVFSESSRAATN
jgi:hypothetical protein